MNATRARKRIRTLARAGKWEMTAHAVERMVERDATVQDVFSVLVTASTCRNVAGRWRIGGVDAIGERLELVVELTREALVVTLFRGDES